jgi:hypothetical protein
MNMNKPAPSERSFGVSVGSVLLVLGAIASWRHRQTTATTLLAIGGVLLVFGLLAPVALRIPNRIWWRFAQTLGWVNSRILLTLFFAIVLTPIGVVMRLTGHDPLRSGGHDSNWRPYPERHRDPKHFEHLF